MHSDVSKIETPDRLFGVSFFDWNLDLGDAFPFGSKQEAIMGLGRGALFWLLGVPLPIIILLLIFWH